jgi:hypothetical protein
MAFSTQRSKASKVDNCPLTSPALYPYIIPIHKQGNTRLQLLLYLSGTGDQTSVWTREQKLAYGAIPHSSGKKIHFIPPTTDMPEQ